MKIIETDNKRSIEFEKIRNGTVFRCADQVYLKGQAVYAINLDTGDITRVGADETKWSVCYIYPGASLKLN